MPPFLLGGSGYNQVESSTQRTCADGPVHPTKFQNEIGLINPTGQNVGGGSNYPIQGSPTTADFYVANTLELIEALDAATSGETIFLDTYGDFDLTLQQIPLTVREGVTLAGDRGLNGSPGALVHVDEVDNNSQSSAFLVSARNTRFTGFRLRGPWDGQNYGDHPSLSVGLRFDSEAESPEVDNMEIYQFTWGGILLKDTKRAHVHHNNIHSSNSNIGYAYGVVLAGDSDVLVEANRFNDHRHAVAGSGAPGQSYEARYNIVESTQASHAFDMHGQYDSDPSSISAGDQIYIHHNRILTPTSTVVTGVAIRDVPYSCAWITHNSFVDVEDRAIRQRLNDHWASPLINIIVQDNVFDAPATF